MNPLISIIVPVFNRQQELMLSLASIAKQSYRPLEVIVVDDGSEIQVTEKFIKKFLGEVRFILIRQRNGGAPSARNNGFAHSEGEYVIFWDSDTIGNEDMIEKMYITLLENRDASFAYANHIHAGKIKFHSRPFDILELKKNNYINTMSLLRRKDFVSWDESLRRFQDWDLWLTLGEQGKIGVWIDEFLYTSVQTRGGISYWLPSFAYKSPWKYLPFFYTRVKKFEESKKIVQRKHHI